MKIDPFSLSQLIHTFDNPKLNQIFWAPVEWILGFKKLSKLQIKLSDQKAPQEYIRSILEELDIKYHVKTKNKIPETGPLLIVSNHPFGALEAIILSYYLLKSRSDIHIMANIFLKRIDPISKIIFGVNPFKDQSAKKQNQKVMREIYHGLKQGNSLITFPAGDVAQFHFKKPYITDDSWEKQIAHLARSTNANVLPIFVEGRNSFWFYLLSSSLHSLRYGLELLNKKDKIININIGNLITPDKFSLYKSNTDLIKLFREECDQLNPKHHKG